jgi:uncharacterized damage-inducible protein DinB
MIAVAESIDRFLTKSAGEALAQLDGIPDDDLNHWRPQEDLADINTLYAIATHLVGSGEYWVLHLAGGRPLDRDRPAEFRATGTLDQLKARYDRWLAGSRDVLAHLTPDDLARSVDVPMEPGVPWTVSDCLAHAVEHSAVHVGHLQIQRQLWDAERGT